MEITFGVRWVEMQKVRFWFQTKLKDAYKNKIATPESLPNKNGPFGFQGHHLRTLLYRCNEISVPPPLSANYFARIVNLNTQFCHTVYFILFSEQYNRPAIMLSSNDPTLNHMIMNWNKLISPPAAYIGYLIPVIRV